MEYFDVLGLELEKVKELFDLGVGGVGLEEVSFEEGLDFEHVLEGRGVIEEEGRVLEFDVHWK